MWITLPEAASTEILLKGRIDEVTASFISQFLKEGQTFFDVGAHLGYFSLLALRRVGESGRVVAFEPTPSSFSVLKRNTCNTSIMAFPYAVWRQRSTLPFHLYGQRFSAYNSFFAPRVAQMYAHRLRCRTVEVATISIDEFVVDHKLPPDMIKIDAESAELSILEGAQQTLHQIRPSLIVEVGDLSVEGAASSAFVVDYLQSQHRYTPFEWNNGAIRRHIRKTDRYEAGNLLFLPSESL